MTYTSCPPTRSRGKGRTAPGSSPNGGQLGVAQIAAVCKSLQVLMIQSSKTRRVPVQPAQNSRALCACDCRAVDPSPLPLAHLLGLPMADAGGGGAVGSATPSPAHEAALHAAVAVLTADLVREELERSGCLATLSALDLHPVTVENPDALVRLRVPESRRCCHCAASPLYSPCGPSH